jgi:phage tail-like protein
MLAKLLGEYGVINNNRFILCVGVAMLSFAKVSNIGRKLEHENIQEGGHHYTVHTFTKPRQQRETLILEKGVNISRLMDRAGLAALGLKPGGRIKMPVSLVVLGKNSAINSVYSFEEGIVVGWELGELNAMGNEVLIERFEIAHSGLLEII